MTKKSNKTVLPIEPEDWCERMERTYDHVLWERDAVEISGLPAGWENTVEDLLRSIDEYTRTPRNVCDLSLAYKFKIAYNSILRKLIRKIKPRPWISGESGPWSKVMSVIHNMCFMFILSTKSHYRNKYPPQVSICQIKEKYATLRVYHNGGDDRVKGMIDMAESICSVTCQSTGSRTGVYTNISGWVSILDPKVAKKIRKARGITSI